MIIKLVPIRSDETLEVVRAGDVITMNGQSFDFGRMGDGDTLPRMAVSSTWFAGDVVKSNGDLTFILLLPLPVNYSPEQAFPADLVDVPDGRVAFPLPLPDSEGGYPELPPLPVDTAPGVIDWTKLITKAMKDAAALAEHLGVVKAELAARNAKASTQIARIQDRIDTIGYGIDAGEATAEDEAEQAALMISLKAWKAYKFALGKVTAQSTWPAAPVWPVEPAVPVIDADPQAVTVETM